MGALYYVRRQHPARWLAGYFPERSTMAKDLIAKPFDYSLLDKDVSGKLRYHAGQLTRWRKAHAEAIIETGRGLAEVQELLADHAGGVFVAWVEAECGFSKRTAYNYIAAFDAFGGCANFAQLEPSAMYLLAGSDEAVQKAAIKLANKGKSVSHAVAKELVAEAKAAEPTRLHQTPEPITVDAVSVTPTEPAGEPCPNCGGTEWSEDTTGVACASCFHPQGEPLGDLDPGEPEWKTLQKKTVNTINALMRCFDDLHAAKKNKTQWSLAVNDKESHCKQLLTIAKEW